MKHPLTTGLVWGALLLGGYHYRNEINRAVTKNAVRFRIIGRDFQQLLAAGKDVINNGQAVKRTWDQLNSSSSLTNDWQPENNPKY